MSSGYSHGIQVRAHASVPHTAAIRTEDDMMSILKEAREESMKYYSELP